MKITKCITFARKLALTIAIMLPAIANAVGL